MIRSCCQRNQPLSTSSTAALRADHARSERRRPTARRCGRGAPIASSAVDAVNESVVGGLGAGAGYGSLWENNRLRLTTRPATREASHVPFTTHVPSHPHESASGQSLSVPGPREAVIRRDTSPPHQAGTGTHLTYRSARDAAGVLPDRPAPRYRPAWGGQRGRGPGSVAPKRTQHSVALARITLKHSVRLAAVHRPPQSIAGLSSAVARNRRLVSNRRRRVEPLARKDGEDSNDETSRRMGGSNDLACICLADSAE